MSDADTARTAKSLAEIAQHLKQLNKILETMNTNFVDTARILKSWLEIAEEEPTLSEVHEDVQKIQDLVEEINDRQRVEGHETTIGDVEP